jgi:hypothetical protein
MSALPSVIFSRLVAVLAEPHTPCDGKFRCAVSGILSSGMPIDPEDLGNGIGCLACRDSLGDLLL